MARGGYRKPANPAPVSGPGSLSRRTDGGPVQAAQEIRTGQYGESKAVNEMQAAAPMAGNRTPVRSMPKVTPLLAPSNYPEKPGTYGMPFGEGPGPDVLALPEPQEPVVRPMSQILADMVRYDNSGEVNALLEYLSDRGL